MSLNGTTGIISGTPTTANTYNFTITTTDTNGCTGTKAYSVVINAACPTITLSPASLPNGTVGVAYTQTTISATGGAAPYTYSVPPGTLPTWLTLNSTTGELSGTPTASGSSTFTITAKDKNGCVGSKSYTVTVGCPTLTLSPATLPDGKQGEAYSQTITVTGGKSPYTFALTSGALPGGLSLNATTGVISGTPLNVETSNFTITATDSNKCTGSKSYSIKVVSGCPTITISPDTLPDGLVSSAYSQTISASGGTAPYTYSVSSGAIPSGLTLTGAGVISGTPTTKGSYTFTILATDSKGCTGSKQYSLTIKVTPPVITDIKKMQDPFRLKITGYNFHPGCVVKINEIVVESAYKSSNKLIVKKGDALKALLPKGVAVQITVENKDDGGVSDPKTFVR